MDLGAKITTVHKVIKFEQEAWLQSYIDFNLNKRLETGQDLFKLANNSVFGKTMENVRKYRNVKFISDPLKVKNLIASSFYDNCEIIKEDSEEGPGILMMELKQKTVKLCKPIYCGMKILDLSKYHMYDIWYTLLKPIF